MKRKTQFVSAVILVLGTTSILGGLHPVSAHAAYAARARKAGSAGDTAPVGSASAEIAPMHAAADGTGAGEEPLALSAGVPVRSINATPSAATVPFGTSVTLSVIATYTDGTTKNVSKVAGTVYTLIHGSGTLKGNAYTANQVESTVITVAYTSGGITAYASVDLTVTNPTPVLSAVSPSTATVGSPSATITLTGSKFVAGAQAQWGDVGLTTTFVSSGKLTAAVPASDLTATGTFKITVLNPGAGSPTSGSIGFVVKNPAPVLTKSSPNAAIVGSGALTVTLTGTGFVAGSQAQWDGIPLATTPVSDSSLSAVVPASDLIATGSHKFTVKNPAPGGGASASVAFAVNNPTPVLTGLSQTAGVAGSPGLTVTATGSGFITTSKVEWGGVALATTYASAMSLTFVLPKNDLALAGEHLVTVWNPAPGGGASGAIAFLVDNPGPTVSSLSQTTALLGSANLAITAVGSGFVTTSKAEWDGGVLATTYVSATKLTFVLPKSDLTAAGTHSITVNNPAPGGGGSASVPFTVNNPVPALVSLGTSSAVVASAAVTVQATGKEFAPTSVAQWDGIALATSYVSPTAISFVIPSSDLAAAGSHKITVSNSAPGGGSSASLPFVVVEGTASITGTVVDSLSGGGVSGLLVTFNGTTVSGKTGVKGAFKVTVPLSATGLFVLVPSGAASSSYYDVVVYQGALYYTSAPYSQAIPLPALQNGQTVALGTIMIYNVADGPPPPP